jgi:uncharacterized protein with GYD domain
LASYLVLLSYTQQGVANIKESPARVEAARKAIREAGGEMKAFYLALGQYDAVCLVEMPDETTVARFALATGRLGNVRTQTLRLFTEEEFRQIVASL